ncbi:hypothetical protein GQ55_1G078000 [Panicum hallii var. hallii]|uniref:Uncharacterized protein n=1 Tax=Panicum hallii var. hallii TaxID=1504633 RepID=A0A2T7F3E5_9POAL|nr:hypothetical protein GQ55_1G078000 [Panicum hallii var. hallii]
MAGLQRSAQTFRRSGSSGLVWDERFLTEGAEDGGGGARGTGRRQPELRHSRSVGSLLQRGEEGAGRDDKKRKLVLAKPKQKDQQKQQQQQEVVPAGGTAFRTRDVAPAAEAPSPRLPAGCCAPCAIFRAPPAPAPPRRWRA